MPDSDLLGAWPKGDQAITRTCLRALITAIALSVQGVDVSRICISVNGFRTNSVNGFRHNRRMHRSCASSGQPCCAAGPWRRDRDVPPSLPPPLPPCLASPMFLSRPQSLRGSESGRKGQSCSKPTPIVVGCRNLRRRREATSTTVTSTKPSI